MNEFIRVVDKWLLNIPSASWAYLNHKKMKQRYYKYMQKKLGHFMVEVDPGPAGDKEIILKTSILREEEIPLKINPNYYFLSGYQTMLGLMKILERYSFNLRTSRAIMEFGCGSARLIRHLRCIDGIRLFGTDVDANNIAWCQNNLPGIEFYNNKLFPPLSFAEDDSFDLIIAFSVFTHIPLETQHLWIEELYRVLRPRGFLLANMLGPYHQQQMLSPHDLADLKKSGSLTLDANNPRASFSTQDIRSWDVFQTRGEVLRAFGSMFHINDYRPGPLDLLILQKLPEEERY